MNKLVLLILVVSVASVYANAGHFGPVGAPYVFAPYPWYPYRDYLKLHEPIAALKAGAFVESVPAAVSHQSSSIVHSRAHIITPPAFHHPSPIIKTLSPAPVVVRYHGPHHW